MVLLRKKISYSIFNCYIHQMAYQENTVSFLGCYADGIILIVAVSS